MEVLLFGIAKEIVGEKKLIISPEENITTVAELKNMLKKRYPALQGLVSMAVAIDSQYAIDTDSLSNAKEVALIPPVSGG